MKQIVIVLALLVAVLVMGQTYESDGYHRIDNNTVTAMAPYQGCCAIIINHKDKTVNYISELGTDLEPYCTLEEMDEIINAMQEHCYHNHYTEY